MICPKCQKEYTPIAKTSGSFLLEMFLWIMGIVFWPLLLVALWYTISRVKNKVAKCPHCFSENKL